MIDENATKRIQKIVLQQLLEVARRIEHGSPSPIGKEAAKIAQRFTHEQMLSLGLDDSEEGLPAGNLEQ
jgi:hypothetical protein